MYVPLTNLLEGSEHDVIVRLQVGGHAPGSTVELLDAALSFAYGGTAHTRSEFLSTTATDDAAKVAEGIDAKVMLAAARAQTASATLRVIQMARAGQLAEAEAELERVRVRAHEAVETFDDPKLARLAQDLDKLQETLPELVPPAPANPPAGPLATPAPPAPIDARDYAEAPEVRRDRARHNRRAHSRAYEELAPRMAE
jgi:hypothetical protein